MFSRRAPAILFGLLISTADIQILTAQEPPRRFGGKYEELDVRRQRLLDDWVGRFTRTTGQSLEPGPLYDEVLSLSTKTTFDAVTQALLTTPLTDESGQQFGDALSLVEQIDAVSGEIPGRSSDRQFRMYVRLIADARQMLERSREFNRGMDNTIYHRGYPVNYREQRGTPSIQISIALDGRRADVDVDYRTAIFPIMLFNGHLSASNSDVRAGDNADRHAARWNGFENWWRGFFGVRVERTTDAGGRTTSMTLPKVPRAGKKNIDVMAQDFLNAWLVEGDVVAAMGYISDRAYGCLAAEAPDPSAFDRGLAPYQLMINLKAAHEALGLNDSLDDVIVGVRLPIPALRVVRQPHHAQFVIYNVPDDVAASFDCEGRLLPNTARPPARAYGNFFGSTFYVKGQQNQQVALLWAREDGYWKVASWRIGLDAGTGPAPEAIPEARVARIKPEPGLVDAARSFLEDWLIDKDYDRAFHVLSARSYGCYNLLRNPAEPAAASADEAARRIHASLERVGREAGSPRDLAAVISAVEPFHPAVRVMDHPHARTFTLAALPAALGDAAECDARARAVVPPDPLPLEFGAAFSLSIRFRTTSGEAPVLRLLWRREEGSWWITSFDVETP